MGLQGCNLSNVERIRECPATTPSDPYFRQKLDSGWRLVAVEWERDVPKTVTQFLPLGEDVPFGSQVSDDCQRLQDNTQERLVLTRMLELIVKDQSLSAVAAELNKSGYRTRPGREWTPGAVFDMLPRLIEVGPRIMTDADYIGRKRPASV